MMCRHPTPSTAIRLQSKYSYAAKQPAFVFVCQQRVI
jgi:hypothetical protein